MSGGAAALADGLQALEAGNPGLLGGLLLGGPHRDLGLAFRVLVFRRLGVGVRVAGRV